MSELLARLQQWYLSNYDDGEHSYGVSISVLDNPGWSLKINLSGTSCQGLPLEDISAGDSEVDQLFAQHCYDKLPRQITNP